MGILTLSLFPLPPPTPQKVERYFARKRVLYIAHAGAKYLFTPTAGSGRKRKSVKVPPQRFSPTHLSHHCIFQSECCMLNRWTSDT